MKKAIEELKISKKKQALLYKAFLIQHPIMEEMFFQCQNKEEIDLFKQLCVRAFIKISLQHFVENQDEIKSVEASDKMTTAALNMYTKIRRGSDK